MHIFIYVYIYYIAKSILYFSENISREIRSSRVAVKPQLNAAISYRTQDTRPHTRWYYRNRARSLNLFVYGPTTKCDSNCVRKGWKMLWESARKCPLRDVCCCALMECFYFARTPDNYQCIICVCVYIYTNPQNRRSHVHSRCEDALSPHVFIYSYIRKRSRTVGLRRRIYIYICIWLYCKKKKKPSDSSINRGITVEYHSTRRAQICFVLN